MLYFLRIRADLSALALSDAATALADLGHPGPRLHIDHYVRSPALRVPH
ncbi:hypothetical protein [Rhodococcus jostii]